MRILISGAGIAGPTLAYWLGRSGHNVALVEVANDLRTGGYIIDFWGAGFDVAERMGLLPELLEKGYQVREVRVVDRNGQRLSGFDTSAFARLAGGRFVSLPRGELAASVFAKIRDTTETIFGDEISAIDQFGDGVEVRFERARSRRFDLVIGADGLHSRVRALVFGPERDYEKFLGYHVAAFEAEGYRPRDDLVYVMYTEVGQQVARFTMRGNRTLFLFIWSGASEAPAGTIEERKAILRRRFGSSGWECRQILDRLDASPDLYFDRVSQIRMGDQPGTWTRGRVGLVGDAAFCVSLLAGQGSALAMISAYVLAGELSSAAGNPARAFMQYQQRLAPFILKKQNAALRFGGYFAPGSPTSLFLRNQVMKVLSIPWIADVVVGRDFRDRLALPVYR